ncbi:anhydro-N-acetylmuramic acid kinase [Legionella brunensis]|uniref:Anhydro-N-acetylmuramic acid kinase n=2 Tax=Legionella brunensis TaxID=29422 RepID=A0A0W0S5L3_9GAMM|nr:anhydro-N-acetylmuramic acid kinase [Legionella brunensis]
MDGIDAALIDLESNQFIAGITRPYSENARCFLERVLRDELHTLKTFSQLNTILGREFAQAVFELMDKVHIPKTHIKSIGSHGQTLCHDAAADIPYTIQLGCPHTIAELTGMTVVADFRTRDLVVGGQGAPFAPIYHQALFKDYNLPLAVVNIGGIANLTYLAEESRVHGYDIGPGNCLMDFWIKQHLGYDYDSNGDWAVSGHVIEPLLESLLQDPFFKKSKPKSIGKEYFSNTWLENYLQPEYSSADIQATLLMLTAKSIAEAIRSEEHLPKHLMICGGGAHNQALLRALGEELPNVIVKSTGDFDISPDFIEASMFAWLAEKTLTNTPLDMSQITGAKRLTILGTIYPAGIDKGN